MGKIEIGHGLQIQERNSPYAHRALIAQGKRARQTGAPGLVITSPDQGAAGDWPAAEFSGDLLCLRSKGQINVPFQVARRLRHEVSPAGEEAGNIGLRAQSFPQQYRSEWMQPDLKLGYYSEVAPASAQGPKQIGVFGVVAAQKGTIRGHDHERLDVIEGQSKAPSEPSRSSAQNQPRGAGVGNDSGGKDKPC